MTDEELDRLLDGALQSYTIEPPDGIEERVLRGTRRSRAAWVGVAGAAAALICALLLLPQRTSIRSPDPSARTQIAQIQQMAPVAVRSTPAKKKLAVHPKLDQFPAPEPLSPQELALLRFVQNNPEQALAVIERRQQDEKRAEDSQ